ncbi:MAG TPA: TonB-dependent receptor [Rhizomicrobium sp.]
MSRIFWGSAALALAALLPSQAADPIIETVVVTGMHGIEISPLPPGNVESITADTAAVRNNAVTSEEMLDYLPDILVRERHFGDTQDPITTRTSGVGSSARSLIYADGILLSALIGNNNGTASPHWGLVAPQDISRIDVLYGPFAAQYPGNSLGAVVVITTRMPEQFETYAKAVSAFQDFSQYGTRGSYGTIQASAGIGDRAGNFSWRLSLDHLDTSSQPLAYVTLAKSPAPPDPAAPTAIGAFSGFNRLDAPVVTIGAGGFEHQIEDTETLKLGYDIATGLQATYTASLFHQDDDARAQSYLKDGSGDAIYAGSANIDGAAYSLPASAFSNNVYHWGQTQLAQALSLQSDGGRAWNWEVILTRFDDLEDDQRVPSLALPAALAGGAGTATRMNGTDWMTADAWGEWRGAENHDISFGFHHDVYDLSSTKYNVGDWLSGPLGAVATQSRGTTATDAVWIQDDWRFAPGFKAVIGGRYENWRAYDGLNFSSAPALDAVQPKENARAFSPKLSLTWRSDTPWTITASFGEAYRMPTVGELYQAITTGPILTVPNPNLKPEHGRSYDLTAARDMADGRLRLSYFQEDLWNALLSQSTPLVVGSTSLFNFVQNVDRVRSRGFEIVLEQRDLIEGVDFSGSATYVDSHILKDAGFAAAIGKQTPSIPKFRATLAATWRANDNLSLTLAGRYSDRVFATIDNTDSVSDTWQGFGAYLVLDARLHYKIAEHWSASFGIDNLGNRKYFLYHPFPQRTFIMDLRYAE